jgi:hypothetical protein
MTIPANNDPLREDNIAFGEWYELPRSLDENIEAPITGDDPMPTHAGTEAVKEQKKELPSLKIGDAVIVIALNPLGNGAIKPGDIGILMRRSPLDTLELAIGEYENWICPRDIVEKVSLSKEEREAIIRTAEVKHLADEYLSFQNYTDGAIGIETDKIRTRIAELEAVLGEMREDEFFICTAMTSRQHQRREVNTITNTRNFVEKLLQYYYSSITISYPNIIAITKPVIIKYKPQSSKVTTDINIGVFQVTIRGRKLLIVNTNRAINGIHHPHIQDSHFPCLGDYANSIQNAIGGFDYLIALDNVSSYLHSYDKNSCYQKIQYWLPKELKDNTCPHCEHSYDECECERCDYCRQLIDNCECITCPDTDNVIDDTRGYASECESCNYRGRNGEHLGCTY